VWLAEDEAVTFGDGVGGKNDGGFRISDFGLRIGEQLTTNGRCLAIRKFGYEPCRAGFAADAAFNVFGRWHDSEVVTGLLQKLAATR
jgi:hypothetical protein